MGLNAETSAALVYLILYALLLVLLLFGYLTGHLSLRSRYTIILFHVIIRLASQSAGLAFGIVGFSNPHILVAYFVLGGKLFPCFLLRLANHRISQQLKVTSRLCFAPSVLLSLGNMITAPLTIHGLSQRVHQTPLDSRGFLNPFHPSVMGENHTPWPSSITY